MRKRALTLLTAAILIASFSAIAVLNRQSVSALTGSEFQSGRIIDDSVFFNSSALTASQVQSFLNSKVPECDTDGSEPYAGTTRAAYGTSRGYPPPYTCLKDYTQALPFKAPEDSLCNGITSTGSTKKSAAFIIDTIARSCGVSQKVLIVLLEKEQSLVTDEWPWSIQYRSATGYGCPDTAPCDSQYYGFFNQVYNAARIYKYYAKYPNSFNHIAKTTNFILYNPNTACGGSNIFIQNQATAGLYNYTPYQPNAAALNNLYGSGNSCSAYGNRNFWRIYNDWFGSTIKSFNIIPVVYDNSTDTTGELATIGFKLSAKPNAPVSFLVHYNSVYAQSAEYRITISPSNWDNPKKNIVILKGKNTPGLVGNVNFDLTTGSLSSSDSRFNLSSSYTPDVPILHQDLSKKVYRLFNTDLSAHLFTGSETEKDTLVGQGWRDEGVAFYGCEAGNIPIARLNKSSNYKLLQYGSADYDTHIGSGFEFQSLITTTSSHATKTLYIKYRPSTASMFYTLNETEGDSSGFSLIGTMKVCDSNISPVFRLYSASAGNHFYTKSANERNSAREKYGFAYEGVGFYLTDNGTTPVYRLFSSQQSNHFYTTSESEKNSAVNNGFVYEGVAFNLNESDTRNVYRLFSGQQGDHFYTASESEKNNAQAAGYRLEGVGFQSY